VENGMVMVTLHALHACPMKDVPLCATTKYHFLCYKAQALVSFKKYMPPPLPYFKVNIYPFPLVSECGLLKISVNETDTTTSGLRWIFHMHSEFSRPAMCNNAT
jgi:hypothetical protein